MTTKSSMNRAIPRRAVDHPPTPLGRPGLSTQIDSSHRHDDSHRYDGLGEGVIPPIATCAVPRGEAATGSHEDPSSWDQPSSGYTSLDQVSYRRFDRRHDIDRPESPNGEPFGPGSPITETRSPIGRVPEVRRGDERDGVAGEGDRVAGHPAGVEERVEDDLAVTLRSLLRLHAADLIVTLQRWGERLDTRAAILDLRAAHLDLLQRRGRATPPDRARARDRGADPEPPETSVRAGKPRGWRHELGWQHDLELQRQAIDRLRRDAEQFADRLDSPPGV